MYILLLYFWECHFMLTLTCHFKCSYISPVLRDDDEAITVNDVAVNILHTNTKKEKHLSYWISFGNTYFYRYNDLDAQH